MEHRLIRLISRYVLYLNHEKNKYVKWTFFLIYPLYGEWVVCQLMEQ